MPNVVEVRRRIEAGTRYADIDITRCKLRGVRFGIDICSDTRFADASAPIATQGAQLLLVPAQNMLRRAAAIHWKNLHNTIRAERVRETGMWLAS